MPVPTVARVREWDDDHVPDTRPDLLMAAWARVRLARRKWLDAPDLRRRPGERIDLEAPCRAGETRACRAGGRR
ncbi:MAG: hypothetical protein ACYCXY_10520 [Acidimicrobiales bacterium]